MIKILASHKQILRAPFPCSSPSSVIFLIKPKKKTKVIHWLIEHFIKDNLNSFILNWPTAFVLILCCWTLYQLPTAALTNRHKTAFWNNMKLSSYHSEDQSKVNFSMFKSTCSELPSFLRFSGRICFLAFPLCSGCPAFPGSWPHFSVFKANETFRMSLFCSRFCGSLFCLSGAFRQTHDYREPKE